MEHSVKDLQRNPATCHDSGQIPRAGRFLVQLAGKIDKNIPFD
jgi:hypothetical protein